MESNSEQTNQTQNPTPTQTPSVSTEDNSLLMGVLAYLGILVIIPFLMAKDQPFVKYHVRQGIVLCGLGIIVYVLGTTFMPYSLYQLLSLLNLGIVILAIFGIVNVVQKKEAPLPLIGHLADKIKI